MSNISNATIKYYLQQSLLNKGYYKQYYDENGNLITDKTKLPDDMDALIDAICIGLANYINTNLRVDNPTVAMHPMPIPGSLTQI